MWTDGISAIKFVQCFTIKTKSSGNSTVAKLQRVSFAFVDHVLTFFLIPLVPLLRLQRAIKSRFLCVKTIDNSIKKFSYNEHPLITTNFCIFFTHKSGIWCLTKGSHELWYMYISGGYQGGTAGQVYQAPPGYMPAGSAAGQQHPSYMQPGSTVVVQPQPSVVIVGGCPACRVRYWKQFFFHS